MASASNLYDRVMAAQSEVARLQIEKRRIAGELSKATKEAAGLRKQLLESLGRKRSVRKKKEGVAETAGSDIGAQASPPSEES